MARACLVEVGWRRWAVRVAGSGRAAALKVVWPVGLNGCVARRPAGCLGQPASRIRILASQPACAVRSTLTEAPWVHTLYDLAVQLGIRSCSTVVRLYGTAVWLYGLYSSVPYRSVYVCTVAMYSCARSPCPCPCPRYRLGYCCTARTVLYHSRAYIGNTHVDVSTWRYFTL